jgi:vacuolar-type H+-ATPase subunit H
MLRQDPARLDLARDAQAHAPQQGVDIQQELNVLEEFVLDSPRIPLTGKTIVDEEQILDQLDLIRINLPDAFERAQQIIAEKDTILAEAEEYARQIAAMAEQRAAQILEETGIIQQAERQAQQIRLQVQQECEALQQQTLREVEQVQGQARQEFEQTRRNALLEQSQIQEEADRYADGMLSDLEQRLSEMLRVVKNGRQQVSQTPPTRSAAAETKETTKPKAAAKQNSHSKGTGHRRNR